MITLLKMSLPRSGVRSKSCHCYELDGAQDNSSHYELRAFSPKMFHEMDAKIKRDNF